MSIAMRRELCREATGPTAEEFASEGATFLVGMIRPAYPNRLSSQYKVTPRDDWFYPYAYVDDIGVLVGELVGEVFEQDEPVEVTQQRLRNARRGERRERRTQMAASALTQWLAREGGEINGTWVVPSGKGHGVLVDAEDEFSVRAFQQKARELAKKTRTYYAVVQGESPGEYLIAFVTEARYTPLDFASAVALADATTDSSAPVMLDKSEPGEVTARPDLDAAADTEAATAGFSSVGEVVGNIFQKLKESLESKKPEKIQKKIDKLEAELVRLKAKLEEAEGSSGLLIGNVYGADSSMLRRFRGAEAQEYERADGGLRMFKDASDVDYGEMDDGIKMFRGASDVDYGEDDGGLRMFRDASDVDYGELGEDFAAEGIESREDLEEEILGELQERVADGEMSERQYEALVDRMGEMSNEELMELYEDLADDDGSGFVPTSTTSMTPSVSSPSSSSSKRKQRRQKRRQRRRSRRKSRRSRVRNRRSRRKSRKGGKKGGGGGGGQQQPQIIVIREGGGGGGDEGDEDDGYEDDYDDDSDESDGVGAFAYGGPGYGDAALRMSRNVDLPRSPNGFVINYPVG